MSRVVRIQTMEPAFPARCAGCNRSAAEAGGRLAGFELEVARETLHIDLHKHHYHIPVCPACQQRSRAWYRYALLAVLVLAATVILCAHMYQHYIPAPLKAVPSVTLIAAVLFLAIGWSRRPVRVYGKRHHHSKEIDLRFANDAYAAAFLAANAGPAGPSDAAPSTERRRTA